jgi:hypothetical protein
VTNLPSAIQLILPFLASDGGHARVQTLLAIQGVGPDYVRQHLTGINAALGTASPGAAALADLIRKAEDAVSIPSTVRRQHVISQGVLRRFVEDIPPGGRQLTWFDLDVSRPKLKGPREVGYVDHFVPVDSQATENLWQEVENHLTLAITAALNGTAPASPVHLSTLRHAVALHFARNPQTLTIHNQNFTDTVQDQIERQARTPLAADAFRRRYGLEPGSMFPETPFLSRQKRDLWPVRPDRSSAYYKRPDPSRSNSPLRTPTMNARHSSGVYRWTGPWPWSLVSRTRIMPSWPATSTQPPPFAPLNVLLRQRGPSDPFMASPPRLSAPGTWSETALRLSGHRTCAPRWLPA